MNLNYVKAENSDKRFFWDNYCQSMQPHIEEIWGWDEEWQLADFQKRWVDCENSLIRIDEQTVGYIQIQDIADEHYIMMLILLPAYRSAGIGGEILAQVKEHTKQEYIGLRVFRTNTSVLNFYQSHGFDIFADEGDFYYLKHKA